MRYYGGNQVAPVRAAPAHGGACQAASGEFAIRHKWERKVRTALRAPFGNGVLTVGVVGIECADKCAAEEFTVT